MSDLIYRELANQWFQGRFSAAVFFSPYQSNSLKASAWCGSRIVTVVTFKTLVNSELLSFFFSFGLHVYKQWWSVVMIIWFDWRRLEKLTLLWYFIQRDIIGILVEQWKWRFTEDNRCLSCTGNCHCAPVEVLIASHINR